MMSALSDASFSTFMDQYAPMMGYEISYDTYHEFKLDIDKVSRTMNTLAQKISLVQRILIWWTMIQTLLFQTFKDRALVILSTSTLLKVWTLRTSISFWKLMMTNWLSVHWNGSVCAIRMFNKRSRTVLSNQKNDKRKKMKMKRLLSKKKKKKTHRSHMSQLKALLRKRISSTWTLLREGGIRGRESRHSRWWNSSWSETCNSTLLWSRYHWNEDDSVFRKLKDCFSDGYHGEWAGFYNKGYPASSKHRHMSGMSSTGRLCLHIKSIGTILQMTSWWMSTLPRHKDQNPQLELQELNNHIEYGCSDARMHPLHQDKAESSSKEAERRIDDDFGNLTKVLQDYVEDHKVLPYCMILHSLAYRYLGGGLSDPTYKDAEFPYRSSPQITAMFWNLGNWCRNRFEKCPVPERFQQFIPHIDYTIDEDHEKFDENKSQFNNYFINVIKNFGGHLFMNCEAGSLYPHRERLDEVDFKTCFNDYHDLMVAARLERMGISSKLLVITQMTTTHEFDKSHGQSSKYLGKTKDRDTDEIVDLTRARMRMTRVCVYHVGQKYASDSAGIVGECLAVMAFECARYQVDFIAGDGNKACYYSTPKSPGVLHINTA